MIACRRRAPRGSRARARPARRSSAGSRRRRPGSPGSSRSSSRKLVSTITRLSGARTRSSRIAPTPSSPGITRSIRITSGYRRCGLLDRLVAVARLADDLEAVLQLQERRAAPRARPRGRRPAAPGSRQPSPSTSVDRRAARRAPSGSRAGRRARGRAPPSRSARGGASGPRRSAGSNPTPSSAHLDGHPSGRCDQPNGDVLGAGVLHGVVERLVGDPQDREVALAASPLAACAAARRPRARSPTPWMRREHLELLAQRALEAVALELGRAQTEDQRAQLVERLARERAQPLELGAGRGRVASRAARRRPRR